MTHESQVAWCRATLSQKEIDRLAVAGVDGFAERCRVAKKAAA